MLRVFLVSALVAFASAYSTAPIRSSRVASSKVEMMSRFEGKIWTMEAKMTILDEWNPEEARGYNNL
jgi:hypothetical protein